MTGPIGRYRGLPLKTVRQMMIQPILPRHSDRKRMIRKLQRPIRSQRH